MPKMTSDRDDSRGGLGGNGGPQDGPIGSDDQHQRQGGGSTGGEGAQRHEAGSSRDPENLK